MKILFVDDDRNVLEGIERALFTEGCDWDARFALGGEQALAELEAWPAEIVVSDMRMPGMDGAELLRRVQQRWPDTLRVVLSGHTQPEEAIRAMQVAHQFIGKPCQGSHLLAALERLIWVRQLIGSQHLREMLGSIAKLPPSPRSYLKLRALLGQDQSGTAAISAVIEQDPALSSAVLKMANSAFFRRSHPIVSVHNAVMRLGVDVLHNLVALAECFPVVDSVDVEDLRHRALLASLLARKLTPYGCDAECCATAALLAEVSRLLPEVLREAEQEGSTVSPAQISAYLLGIWGLPLPIVQAVAQHRQPLEHEAQRFGVLGVVHVATALAFDREPDQAYLEAVGMSAHWPEWQQLLEAQRHDHER